jgi:hypothetical protein
MGWRFLMLAPLCAVGLLAPCGQIEAKKMLPPRRFTFKIDPATKLTDLLPTPPKASPLPAYLSEDIWEVPELAYGVPLPAGTKDTEEATAHIIAKINHLNAKEPDGFLKALLANRSDLRGLPFVMGDKCRTETRQAEFFMAVVECVHDLRSRTVTTDNGPPQALSPEQMWKNFKILLDADKADTRWAKATPEDRHRVTVAAIVQIFGPADEAERVGLAKCLAAIPHVDATHALARLALFASSDAVQQAAIEGLKDRPAKDYAPVLLQGLRYPLPVASTRAADALVKLQCKDVLADLVNILDEPDPRAPHRQTIDGKEISVVRELVRINHHRNCVLCHAPANTAGVPRDVLTAPVPLPDHNLSPSGGYSFRSSPDIFVRTDMTYLRQDFSLMMRVENPGAWPEQQRFDFLVRTRVLSEEETEACAKAIAKQGTPPSHLAAQYALRQLTGQQPAHPTPQTWRRLLKLS